MNTPKKKESKAETKKRKFDQITKLIDEFNALGTPSGRRMKMIVETREKPNALQLLMDQARLKTAARGERHVESANLEESKEMEIQTNKDEFSPPDSDEDFLVLIMKMLLMIKLLWRQAAEINTRLSSKERS